MLLGLCVPSNATSLLNVGRISVPLTQGREEREIAEAGDGKRKANEGKGEFPEGFFYRQSEEHA